MRHFAIGFKYRGILRKKTEGMAKVIDHVSGVKKNFFCDLQVCNSADNLCVKPEQFHFGDFIFGTLYNTQGCETNGKMSYLL